MNEELKTELGINEWLELIKEDKNLNGAYISIYQYIYLVEKENQELKKQIEEKIKIGVADHKYASECEDKVIVLETQQKEFIKYLEDEIKLQEEINDKLLATAFEEILQKYKETIGE